jgi:hypothetical protein
MWASQDPHGEFIAAAFVDVERPGKIAVRRIADVIEIILRKGVLPKDYSAGRQPWLDQFEDTQTGSPRY